MKVRSNVRRWMVCTAAICVCARALAGPGNCSVESSGLVPPGTEVVLGSADANGTRLLFSTRADLVEENPSGVQQIFEIDFQSGSIRQISHFEADSSTTLVPNADRNLSRIVFSSDADLAGTNPDGNAEVFLLAGDGTPRQITGLSDSGIAPTLLSEPVISADGQTLAFISNANPGAANPDRSFEVFVVRFQTPPISSPPPLLPALQQISNNQRLGALFNQPAIDGSGTKVVYVKREPFSADSELRLYDTSSELTTLLLNGDNIGNPVIDGQGGRIVFVSTSDITGGNRDGGAELFSIRINGNGTILEKTQLTYSSSRTGQEEAIRGLYLSQDGSRVAYTSKLDLRSGATESPWRLYLHDLNKQSWRQVASSLADSPYHASLSPDGRHLAYESDSGPLLFRADCSKDFPPVLVFPQVADGGTLQSEIILTNPLRSPDQGHLLLYDEDGQPMTLTIDGSPVNSLHFAIAPGGSVKFETGGIGPLKSGYGVVYSSRSDSEMAGNLILNIGSGEVSVPGSPLGKEHHVYVESTDLAQSGVALANLDDRPLKVQLTLRSATGTILRDRSLEIAAGSRVARFLGEIFSGALAGFQGTLHARADRPFALMGLRQRYDGSLSVLSGSESAFPNSGSQVLFYLNAGVDLRQGDFDANELSSMSVFQLTGNDHSPVDHELLLANSHPSVPASVLLRVFNDRCKVILETILVLSCQQSLHLDPFDFPIEGTTYSTRDIFFGDGSVIAPLAGDDFGSGRFVLSATAIGTSVNADRIADFYYPAGTSTAGQCSPQLGRTGLDAGDPTVDLNLCSARPMAFDYLLGDQVETAPGCSQPLRIADESLYRQTAVTRDVGQSAGNGGGPGCWLPAAATAGECSLLSSIEALSQPCSPQTARPVVIVKFAPSTFDLLP